MKAIIKKIQQVLLVLGIATSLTVGIAPLANAADPVDVINNSCANRGPSGDAFCSGTSEDLFAPNGLFSKIINTLIFVIGAVAVVMIIVGGFRYVTSGGDASQVTAAKNTIMYSIVGMVIALLSYAIVNFVITRF